MRKTPWFTAVEVDFNRPLNRLLGRDHSKEIQIGDLVIAYTTDDDQPFGLIAEVTHIGSFDDWNLITVDATEAP